MLGRSGTLHRSSAFVCCKFVFKPDRSVDLAERDDRLWSQKVSVRLRLVLGANVMLTIFADCRQFSAYIFLKTTVVIIFSAFEKNYAIIFTKILLLVLGVDNTHLHSGVKVFEKFLHMSE
jgi:hypothetical protein